MNVLVFLGNNDFSAIDNIITFAKENAKVYVIQCDSNIGMCTWNPHANPVFCKFCTWLNRKNLKRYIASGYEIFPISSIVNSDDKKAAKAYNANFNSISELKSKIYKGVEIGYGAFSSFATLTRNVMPRISEDFKKYMEFMLRHEVLVFEALNRFVKQHEIDKIVFHNGRFMQFKPILGVAEVNKIDFIATEHFMVGDKVCSNYFFNDVPHSIPANIKKMEVFWDKANPETKEDIGKSFFVKRKKGVAAGDKVYTKEQVANELPEGWDNSKENIAIFNSSEDEFCAVSKEFDSRMLFENQYTALKSIFDHYKDDTSKHFYLRIHPNLKNVPFRSHLLLYQLKYDNVTIIPPSSTVSSYALMDSCDKVIVFNSTMGLESAYWGKPVIALTDFYASALGCAYLPKSKDELWKLIETKNLPCLRNSNLEKIGYYFLRREPMYKNINVRYVKLKFLGKDFSTIPSNKFLGGYLPYVIILRITWKNVGPLKFLSKFKAIPESKPEI